MTRCNYFLKRTTLVLLFLVLAGCSTVRPDPPEISLKSLQLVDLNFSHASLQAELVLFNPNGYELTVRDADYRLTLNDVEISQGHSLNQTTLPAHGRGVLTLSFSTAYLDLLEFMKTSDGKEPLSYQLDGTVDVGGFGIFSYPYPVHKKGTVDLEKWTR